MELSESQKREQDKRCCPHCGTFLDQSWPGLVTTCPSPAGGNGCGASLIRDARGEPWRLDPDLPPPTPTA